MMTDTEREYFCAHCQEVTTATELPAICPHCRVVFCADCGTRQKADARWCVGCGKVGPMLRSRMSRCSSFGGVYVTQSWYFTGLGPECDAMWGISTGWDSVEEMHAGAPVTRRWYRETKDGKHETVRLLTAEEEAVLFPSRKGGA